MTWQFTVQDALFFLSLLTFGIIGYQRGWRREVVSLLCILLGVGFLNLNGGASLTRLLYQFLVGTSISQRDLLHSHPTVLLCVTVASLLVMIALGYSIGSRSPQAKDGQERTLGLLLGLITGAVIGAELTYFLLPNSAKSVITSGTVQMHLHFLVPITVLLIVVSAVVVVVIGLMASRPK